MGSSNDSQQGPTYDGQGQEDGGNDAMKAYASAQKGGALATLHDSDNIMVCESITL